MKTKNELSTFFITNTSKIGVAVSGGADSIYLLYKSVEYTKNIVVLHINHQTRPECNSESLFIQEICQNLEVEFIELLAEGLSLDMPNFEDCARKERYRLFLEYSQKNNISHILTAHHQDDLVETVLLKMFRGSLNIFIPKYRALDDSKTIFLARLLLDTSKEEIESFLSKNNIAYKEDPSNKDNKYLRNYLRNDIIPLLSSKIPNFAQKILALSKQRVEEEEFLSLYAKTKENQIFSGDECEISEFLKEHNVIQQRILQNKFFSVNGEGVSRKHLLNIIDMLKKESSITLWQNDRIQLLKQKNKMRFILKNHQITLEKKQFIVHNNKIYNEVLNYKIHIGEGMNYDLSDTIYLRTVHKDDKIIWNEGSKKITQLLKDKKVLDGLVVIKNDDIVGVVSPEYTYIIPKERISKNGLYIKG